MLVVMYKDEASHHDASLSPCSTWYQFIGLSLVLKSCCQPELWESSYFSISPVTMHFGHPVVRHLRRVFLYVYVCSWDVCVCWPWLHLKVKLWEGGLFSIKGSGGGWGGCEAEWIPGQREDHEDRGRQHMVGRKVSVPHGRGQPVRLQQVAWTRWVHVDALTLETKDHFNGNLKRLCGKDPEMSGEKLVLIYLKPQIARELPW